MTSLLTLFHKVINKHAIDYADIRCPCLPWGKISLPGNGVYVFFCNASQIIADVSSASDVLSLSTISRPCVPADSPRALLLEYLGGWGHCSLKSCGQYRRQQAEDRSPAGSMLHTSTILMEIAKLHMGYRVLCCVHIWNILVPTT